MVSATAPDNGRNPPRDEEPSVLAAVAALLVTEAAVLAAVAALLVTEAAVPVTVTALPDEKASAPGHRPRPP